MQSIPYNPALSLGSVVDEKILKSVEALSKALAPADTAQDALNALILAKRSIDMTVSELKSMEIDVSDVMEASADLGKRVAKAAADYAKAMIASQEAVIKCKTDVVPATVGSSIESPIDFKASAILPMPLGAETIKMDAQYFTGDSVDAINEYVSSKTELLGKERSKEMASAATKQTSDQYQNHEIEGTLVITATCTHKYVDLLEPIVLDADRAFECWNHLFPDDALKPIKPGEKVEDIESEEAMYVISGVTYGSSFVGMVHMLRQDTSEAVSKMSDLAQKAAPLMDLSNWFTQKSGMLGGGDPFSSAVKDMLSSSRIDCHCSVVCMGVIPSMKSGEVEHAVKQFKDAPSEMQDILKAQNAVLDAEATVASEAEEGRQAVQSMSVELAKATNIMGALDKMAGAKSRSLDVATLMDTYENYVSRVSEGVATSGDGRKCSIGVPVNYHLKRISKMQIARLWRAKYLPTIQDLTAKMGPKGATGTKGTTETTGTPETTETK